MMKTKRLTYQDWQLLSDYLDGQLVESKKLAVEARLATEPAFSEAYSHLKWTRYAMRHAPRRKVPHNFILTRQMAAEYQSKNLLFPRKRFPFAYGMVSGIASLVFIVMLSIRVFPMMGIGAKSAASEAMPAAELMLADEASEEAAPLEMQSEPMLMQEEAAGTETAVAEEEGFSAMMEAPPEELTPIPTMDDASENETLSMTETPEATESTPAEEMLAAKIPEAEDSGDMTAQARDVLENEAEVPLARDQSRPRLPWQVLVGNIGLVLSALVAILSFLLGMQNRKLK